MKKPAVFGKTAWIAKMITVSFIPVLAEIAMVVGGGPSAWSMQADTSTSAPDDSLHDRFWAHVKDVRCGSLTLSFGGQLRMRYEYYDGLYGGRDIYFYGYLNLFFWANLWDNELDLSVRPYRNLAMYIEYHHFALAEERDAWYTTGLTAYRRDPTGRSGTS